MRSWAQIFVHRASFWRALLETFLLALCLVGLYLITRKPDQLSLTSLAVGLGLAAPAYLALRASFPSGGWIRQGVLEIAQTLIFSSLLLALMALLIAAFGLKGDMLNLGVASALGCFVVATISHLSLRAGLRLWYFWRRVCRRNMALALTHAQLGLVVLFVVGVTVLVMLIGIADAVRISRGQYEHLLPALGRATDKIILTNSVILLMACPVFLFMLVVFGIFSFVFARRTVRRLEDLSRAAEALRQNNYITCVKVEGEDEVARLQASFNDMAGNLAQALSDLQTERDRITRLLGERRELFASVSHELRTPLAVLRSAQEGLGNHPELLQNPEVAHDITIMEHQIGRLQSQLDDLFLLSQAEVECLALNCQPLVLEPLAGEIVNQFARLAWASCKVEVIYQSQDAPLIVWADGSRLEQALVNLLRNALRYTSPGGVVMVETVRRGEYAWLCVRDTGIGIPPEELTKIWSRYYRAGSQPQDGLELNAGLGLPLVKEFIEAMGGNVAVESQPGEGSCFSLGLRLV